MLAIAIAAIGWATSEPGVRASHADARPHLRTAGDLHGDPPGAPGAPADDPLDTSDPTVGRLDPDLLAALQAAARDARSDGVRMDVTSGWRSRAHQQRLFEDAVRKYGSEEERVATPRPPTPRST